MNTAPAAALAIVITETRTRVANHATGESHPVHDVVATGACPNCGDVAGHHGTSTRGTCRLVCGWCGHEWTVAHTA